MARQTKVDSAGRRAAERRAEGSAPNPSDTSASGTYAAPGEPRDASSARAAHRDEQDTGLEGPSQSERVASAASAEAEAGATDSDLAAARVSSIRELGARAARGDDDEDVSIDELLISDSTDSDDEEEEEATDIHPGLSDSLLAESLRPAPVPRLSVEPTSIEATLEAAATPEPDAAVQEGAASIEGAAAPDAEAEPPAWDPVVTAALDAEESAPTVEADEAAAYAEAAVAEADPEEVVVSATAEELRAYESALEAAAAARNVDAEEAAPESVAPESVAPESAAPDSEAAMEVELAPESELNPASEPLDGELAPEPESVSAADLEVEETTAEPPRAVTVPEQSERQTLPEPLAAKRRDAPLPSFDIPEPDPLSARRAPAPHEPAAPVALPALTEDDDDAVTHMGLPVVPEAANDYPAAAATGFAVADPAVAALQSLDADIARGDSRRATTRVIPRLDPKGIPARPRVNAPAGPPIGERLVGLARQAWEQVSSWVPSTSAEPAWGAEEGSPGRRRLSWLVENVLPPLSLVLFGSGLGAGVIMLVDNDAPVQAQAVQALQDSSAPRSPQTLVERARAGDGDALYKITNMPHGDRTSALTLALEAGYHAQKQKELEDFVKANSRDRAPLPVDVVSRMVEYATSSETMLPAFQELTRWPGPVGPDLLYAVWQKAAGGSRAAELAQQLLYSTDQRAKASPALLAALELRAATSCDDYLRVLPAVVRDGDARSGDTLRSLRHNDGCGTDGKQDCYACLRDGPLLDNAIKAVERH